MGTEERRRAVLDRRRKPESGTSDTVLAYLVGSRLSEILINTRCIMASVSEVHALAVQIRDRAIGIQTVVDAEQDQVQEALAKLQAIIDSGAGTAELQEVFDILTEANTKLEAVTTDVAGTIPDIVE